MGQERKSTTTDRRYTVGAHARISVSPRIPGIFVFLTIFVFGSWSGAAVLNLLAIFATGFRIRLTVPEEGTVLAAVVSGA